MGRTSDDAVGWTWSHVPKLLVESLLYPIRASGPLRLLKSVFIGGTLISLFTFLLFGLGRGGFVAAWQAGANPVFLVLIVLVALLPATIPFGYLLRVVQHAFATGELPRFRNRKRLAVLGIQMVSIYFFYLFFPVEVLSWFTGPVLAGIPLFDPGSRLVFILFLYLYPAAVARFAEEERLLSAIPQRLRSTLWSRTYTMGAITSGLMGGLIYVIRLPLSPTNLDLLIPTALIAFYLFIAQHYVIGRTWRAVEAERAASEPYATPSVAPIPTERTDAGGPRDEGVLSAEDATTIRGRFETATRDHDSDTGGQLEALRTLHEEGVLTEAEYEEKRRVIRSSGERTDHGIGTGSTDVEAGSDRTDLDREPTPTGARGTDETNGAENASERRERSAMLHRLYGQDVPSKREYEAEPERPRHGLHRGPEAVPGDPSSDLAERLGTLRDLHDRGLLTEEEYREKRREILAEL